jgi:hypothetical protein
MSANEAKLVGEYVDMTVQEPRKANHIMWPDTISAVALKLCIYTLLFKATHVASVTSRILTDRPFFLELLKRKYVQKTHIQLMN